MITARAWAGKRYAVLGLARSGLATVRALLACGAEVVAWDSDEAKREAARPHPNPVSGETAPGSFSSVRGAERPYTPEGEGLSFADPLTLDLTGFAGVVVSPGVPLNRHPIAAHAKAAGVPVIGDIELFAQARAELPPHKVVGITGTNGKSTTTALVHHILQTAGVPTTMGGNIGLPILAQDPLPAGGVYVLELSSFQIDLIGGMNTDVMILLNITPDHLDRYKDFNEYAEAKLKLFDMQGLDELAVIAIDDEETRRIVAEFGIWGIGQKLVTVSASDIENQSNWPTLQGPHNAQNVAAARAACCRLGVELTTIETGLRTYPGLPHRMERVGERDGVTFINDSKATNAEAAAPALAAFRAVRWIVGGRAKTAEIDACLPYLSHVRSAYTIGEAGAMLAELLRPKLPVTEAGTLDRAVAAAAADAQAGDTVLLSPACASFDQFRDFEDRGDQFRAIVKGLKA